MLSCDTTGPIADAAANNSVARLRRVAESAPSAFALSNAARAAVAFSKLLLKSSALTGAAAGVVAGAGEGSGIGSVLGSGGVDFAFFLAFFFGAGGASGVVGDSSG